MKLLIPIILLTFFGLSFLFLNSKSIEIYDHGKLIMTVDEFPIRDTVINVNDYYISCRKSFFYLEGKIESNFQENAASFRTTRKLVVDIDQEKLNVRSSMF